MNEIAVIGAGAWGTALALQAARAGNGVTLWARDRARADEISARGENPRLPGIVIDPAIRITADLETIAADLLVLCVPVQHLGVLSARLPRGPLVITAKGMEAATRRLPSEILAACDPTRPLAVLSGPNFAHEIARGLPAASAIACPDVRLRAAIVTRLATPAFRLYGNDDMIGTQLGGAAKNVIAIAVGAVIGAGLGENARAALITRGLAEMGRLAAALGGRAETTFGLSGLGDLALTCTGEASRNYSLGRALGAGASLADILAARTGVTEGVATAPALVARATEAACELPICAVVARVLAGQASVADAMEALLARRQRDE